ncbi:hypothetical protein RGU70_00570 [Herbaspirillum sp. RTI4]|uniref:esterase/lipase family protein n=1 Tax=Herbaspirillum sp. RTI4 TaxID=3048640 RepID=UPI002AB337A8|nr:hypothetical protein [Herbaspirillum sp. RTI4]MDY7576820.1 hypothetical protein [Herbaspirillum sp. RTI4]MEA9981416.1 hypothetical protein [Herbaspirillum sp. RTI4]
MNDAFHVVPTSYDDEGFPFWSTPLTPTEIKKKALVLAPSSQAIPVIFVPGVMGSNLKLLNGIDLLDKKSGDFAWRPDFAAYDEAALDAASRQLLLNPGNTRVDKRFIVDKKKDSFLPANFPAKAAEFRGWGSVYWGSYGKVITYLNSVLNQPCFYDPYADKVLIGALFQELMDAGIPLPYHDTLKLDRADIEHMGEYWFPVHAVGYNWLQSNEDSGKYLASEIRRIKALYQKKLGGSGGCKKVILVTHSMGGLVARAAVHPAMGGAADDVLGVLHGVMPALGAAAAYKRMRTGFEMGQIDWFSLGSIKNTVGAQKVAGSNGREVTAVLGHSPGGLQLLPNKVYQPARWLKVTLARVEEMDHHIPIGDNPYASIYREKEKWWRLIHPEWLDPAKKFGGDDNKNAWSSFNTALTKAENFHDKLGHHYHPNTYSFYGKDAERYPTYGTVTWRKVIYTARDPNGYVSHLDANRRGINVDLMERGIADETRDDAKGEICAKRNLDRLYLYLTPPVEAGDGTVPAFSGSAPQYFAPSCVRAQLAVNGIDHQNAYHTGHAVVMRFIAYSICKMTKDHP